MKVTVAIDSFKGSLSTFEAGAAAREGIRRALSSAQVEICPLADGGEGTVDAVLSACHGERVSLEVTGPLGERVIAEYGIIPERQLAVLEMASAAGITLVAPDKRNPLETTTYGVGELIRHAIVERGCRRFLIGIGGSATNDGGTGMLSALGFEFLDGKGNPISRGAIGLKDLALIRCDNAIPALRECCFEIACDVENPLCGPLGCSAVYGPQKGATPDMIRDMDAWLADYAAKTATVIGRDHANTPGAGAAGGMGFAFVAYLGGALKSGIGLVMEATGLEEKLAAADVVVTGEGRLDRQSAMGKAPVGVARLAKKHGKTVVAFSGCVTDDAGVCNGVGIDAFFPILRRPVTLDEAMNKENAYHNLADTAEQVFRLYRAAKE